MFEPEGENLKSAADGWNIVSVAGQRADSGRRFNAFTASDGGAQWCMIEYMN